MKKYLQKLNSTKSIAQQLIFLLALLFLFGLPLLNSLPTFLPRLLLSLIILFALVSLEKINPTIILIGVVIIAIGWIAKISEMVVLEYLTEFTTNIFLFWLVASNVQRIMRLKEVTFYNLFESVNGFLLLCIAFASFVFFMQNHFPLSFVSNNPIVMHHDLVYYTIVTLTTTGYGDILPSTPAAKDFAAVMAISGQFYVAIIMAILVGKFANQNR